MFPESWTHEHLIRHALAEILTNQHIILHNQETEMADLSKLQASVTQLQTDVDALIAKPTVPTQADIDTLQASVDATDAKVKTALSTS